MSRYQPGHVAMYWPAKGGEMLLATSPQIRSGEAVEWIRIALERGDAA